MSGDPDTREETTERWRISTPSKDGMLRVIDQQGRLVAYVTPGTTAHRVAAAPDIRKALEELLPLAHYRSSELDQEAAHAQDNESGIAADRKALQARRSIEKATAALAHESASSPWPSAERRALGKTASVDGRPNVYVVVVDGHGPETVRAREVRDALTARGFRILEADETDIGAASFLIKGFRNPADTGISGARFLAPIYPRVATRVAEVGPARGAAPPGGGDHNDGTEADWRDDPGELSRSKSSPTTLGATPASGSTMRFIPHVTGVAARTDYEEALREVAADLALVGMIKAVRSPLVAAHLVLKHARREAGHWHSMASARLSRMSERVESVGSVLPGSCGELPLDGSGEGGGGIAEDDKDREIAEPASPQRPGRVDDYQVVEEANKRHHRTLWEVGQHLREALKKIDWDVVSASLPRTRGTVERIDGRLTVTGSGDVGRLAHVMPHQIVLECDLRQLETLTGLMELIALEMKGGGDEACTVTLPLECPVDDDEDPEIATATVCGATSKFLRIQFLQERAGWYLRTAERLRRRPSHGWRGPRDNWRLPIRAADIRTADTLGLRAVTDQDAAVELYRSLARCVASEAQDLAGARAES